MFVIYSLEAVFTLIVLNVLMQMHGILIKLKVTLYQKSQMQI